MKPNQRLENSLSFLILRKFKALMTTNEPISNATDDDSKEDNTCVIHVSSVDRKYRWERYPDDD
jgi:hypothetical protein